MKPTALGDFARWCEGQLVCGKPERHAHAVVTDSRQVKPGCIFVALKGENFDGHDFVAESIKKGAIAAVVSQDMKHIVEGAFALIQVEDTLRALQKMALGYRKSLDVCVVGVTGSNGKTSAKEMIASVLAQSFQTYRTQGNLNNHIGVPLSLLSINEEDSYAVIEIGMNHPGEIAPLATIAKPQMAVVLNVGWAHIEFFKDQEGIADEKSQLVRALTTEGLAILNADDPRVRSMKELTLARSVLVGTTEDSRYRYGHPKLVQGQVHFTFQTPDQQAVGVLHTSALHMVHNAATALAVGLEAGVPLDKAVQGLASASFAKGRFNVQPWDEGWLVDDTYNANPDSVVAGVRALCSWESQGRRVVLLGAMGELGERSEELHRWVGKQCAELGVQVLLALGESCKALVQSAQEAGLKNATWFETHEQLAKEYLKVRQETDCVLVKGSRSQSMEKVLSHFGGVACFTH